MSESDRRIEFLSNINDGLRKDFIHYDFVGAWNESDWKDKPSEVRKRVTELVNQYQYNLNSMAASGDGKGLVTDSKTLLSSIKELLVDGKPLDDSPIPH